MPIHTTVKLIGGPKAIKVIRALQANIIDLRKPYQYIIIYLQGRFSETFRKGGEKSWDANSPVTVAIKGSSKPLVQDAFLKRSMTGPTGRGAVRKKGPKRLEFGTTLKYARIVGEGKKGMRVSPEFRKFVAAKTGFVLGATVNIPARPFLYFIPKDIKQIEKILVLYFNNLMTKEGA